MSFKTWPRLQSSCPSRVAYGSNIIRSQMVLVHYEAMYVGGTDGLPAAEGGFQTPLHNEQYL